MKIDKKLIKELVDNLDEFKLTELEYQIGETKIKVSKGAKVSSTSNVSETVKTNNKTKLADKEEGFEIKSPIIGTVYLAPEPWAKQFIRVGDKIKTGQTILIVEAMKTMNHIASTGDGIVKDVLVKDGQPVEFGQTLVVLN